MNEEYEKPNALDGVEQKLNSVQANIDAKPRRALDQKQYQVAQEWISKSQPTPRVDTGVSVDRSKKNWFLRFFIIAFLFFLVAAGYVGYKLYFDSGIDAKNVDILVNAPLAVGAGEVFTFDVLMQNKNQMDIHDVDITVDFPEGTRSVANISDAYMIQKESVGDIAIGKVSKKNYNALLFGEENEKKEVHVSITYQVEGSNAIFEKEKNFEVVLKSTPIKLTVTNVKEITSGQPLTFNVELVSNSTQTLTNVIVQGTYPFGFMYQSSSLTPKEDHKTWIIPKIEPKEVIKFTINGILDGQNNENRYFSFVTGLEDKNSDKPEVVFGNTGTTISLKRPFLDLGFEIQNKNSDVITLNPDSLYEAKITYKNNTEYPLRNVSIVLHLAGNAMDKNSILPSTGFYQSTNNTIIWDNTTNQEFDSLGVGSSGSVTFNFSGKGIKSNSVLVNPEMTFEAEVKGNRNPDNNVPEVIKSSISKKAIFNTQALLNAQSNYYTSVFTNTGPVPPKAEQKTYYTGVVKITNPSNEIENGIVTMKIPNYATYENVYSPTSEKVTYDQITRTLVWNVGDVKVKTGYESNPARAIYFQVSIVPSVSQISSVPSLAYGIRFEGVDTFTKEKISKVTDDISTSISDARGYYDGQVSR